MSDVGGVEDEAIWRRIEGLARGTQEVAMRYEGMSRITKIMLEGTAVDAAAREGVRDARLDRARAGLSSVVWEDGRIRWIPPDEMLRRLGADPVAPPVAPPAA